MKLSIIIPTLGEEKIIEKMLSALRKLNSFEYEIIVSDGNSKDKTVEIAKKYADKVLVHDGTYRQTIGQGRNAGAKVAKGDFLLFLDADVFIPDINSFMKKAEEIFKSDPKLVGLTVSIRVLPEEETFRDKIFFSLIDLYSFITNNIFGVGGSLGEFQMMYRNAFIKAGGYSEDIVVGEDQHFFQKLAKVGKTRYIRSLRVYHTGRRAHNIGWTKLWFQWTINGISCFFLKKSFHKEWKEIR